MPREGFHRGPQPPVAHSWSSPALTSADMRDRYRSDIGPALADHVPIANVDPHSGGRYRAPRPSSLAPAGTLAPARPRLAVGFMFGAVVKRV